jgi:hypothetical protein
MDPKHRNEPKQTEKIIYWFRETNRKWTETDWVSVCFGSHRKSFLFVSRTPYTNLFPVGYWASTPNNFVGFSIGTPIEINCDFRRNYWSKLSKVIGILISTVEIEIPLNNQNRNSKFRRNKDKIAWLDRNFDFVESKKCLAWKPYPVVRYHEHGNGTVTVYWPFALSRLVE